MRKQNFILLSMSVEVWLYALFFSYVACNIEDNRNMVLGQISYTAWIYKVKIGVDGFWFNLQVVLPWKKAFDLGAYWLLRGDTNSDEGLMWLDP